MSQTPGSSTQLKESESSSVSDKIHVDFDLDGRPVGEGATKLSTRIGKLIKSFIPIGYVDWRAIPLIYKEDVWKRVKAEFNVPEAYKIDCMKSWPDRWRNKKIPYRRMLDKEIDPIKRRSMIPDKRDPIDWKNYVDIEESEAKLKSRVIGKNNRAKQTIPQGTGRARYAQKAAKMREESDDPSREIPRHEVWLDTHTKDGTFMNGAAPYAEKLKKYIVEHGDGDAFSQTIENDAMFHVFGPDTRGRTRGVGPISKTQIKASHFAKARLVAERGENESLKAQFNRMESDKFDAFVESQPTRQTQPHQPRTPSVSSMNGTCAFSGNGYLDGTDVELLNVKGQVVATGKLVKGLHEKTIHGREVQDYEEVSVIIAVIKDEPLHGGKQGFANTLSDVEGGGFVAWPKILIRYPLP